MEVIFAPTHSSQNQKHLTYQVGSRTEDQVDGGSGLTTIVESEEIFLDQPHTHLWENEEDEGVKLDASKSNKAETPKAAEDSSGKETNEQAKTNVAGSQAKEWKEVDGQWIQVATTEGKNPEEKAEGKADVETTTSTAATTSTATVQALTTREVPNPPLPPNKPSIVDKFEHMSGGKYTYLLTSFLTVVWNTLLPIDLTSTSTVSKFAPALTTPLSSPISLLNSPAANQTYTKAAQTK